MKLFLLTQQVNTDYDTYDSCVVVAETVEGAKKIHPEGEIYPNWPERFYTGWAYDPEQVQAEDIGETHLVENAVVISSFNAG